MSFAGGLALVASAFLPWLRIGDVALAGVPDPAGFFILTLGLVAVAIALIAAVLRPLPPFVLMLAGVAAVTALVVVWRTGPETVAYRALARAEAVALVDSVPVQPVPPVHVGAGVFVGMAGGLAVVVSGVVGRRRGQQ
jgi:hypothetical protein